MRPFARIAFTAALMCAAPAFAQTQPGAPPAESAPVQGPVAVDTPVESPKVDTSTTLAATQVPPAIAADKANTWLLDLSTGGRVAIQLRPDFAPGHVARIQELTRQKFYDGLVFHRVIDGFMAQGGDPQGNGQGGSKLPDLKAEFNRLPHLRGSVAMARAEAEDSANSQFYLVLMPTLKLDKKYTVFGRVTGGMNFVDTIERGEPPANPTRIVHAYLASDNPPAYANAPAPVAPSITRPAPRRRARRNAAEELNQFPSRLREGVREGLSTSDSLPNTPSPDPSRKREGEQVALLDVALFDFDLPSERIALRPAAPRDSARLLLLDGDATQDRTVTDLPALLRSGDMLVFNDTRVIPAQLEGTRGNAKIGATLHKREGPRRWRAFIRNAKRLHDGDQIDFGQGVTATASDRAEDGSFALDFTGDELVELLLERAGTMPLPPYIAGKRPTDERDQSDYQTMFAAEPGAVAAPTAALHFTPGLMGALQTAGISHATLTLHVGAGTFLPVKAEDTDDHKMHAEWGRIDPTTADKLNAVRANGGRIIAVGTTSLRLIESACGADGVIRPFEGDTAIFITPGYQFMGIDGLVTNFHLPKSTLFMLVSALMGLDRMQAAYAHAITQGYRFYSYGDASLLIPDRA